MVNYIATLIFIILIGLMIHKTIINYKFIIKEIKKKNRDYNNYYLKKFFLTYQEKILFEQLTFNFKNKEVYIFPNVKLSDIINIKNSKEYLRYKGYINQSHIDFLLTDYNYKILGAIELNGNEHYYNKNRIKSDKFKKELFKNLNIPFFVFKNNQYRNFSKLNKVLFST